VNMFTTGSGRLHPVWAFVLSVMLSALAFQGCASLAEAVAGNHYLVSELVFRTLLVLVLLGLYSWLLTTADHIEEHRVAAMGLPYVRGWFRQWTGGCILGFGLVVLAIILIVAVSHGFHADLHLTSRTVPRLVAALAVLITGSLAEELMFRGYPFQRLEEGIGAVGAIAVFSILFGVVHLLNPGATVWGLGDTILIGIVLAIAYLRTRALWLPWGIHFAWNATLGLLLGLPVSGLRVFNVVVRSSVAGPAWLTGGGYGIEASATGAVVVLIGMATVWKWPLRPLRGPMLSAEDKLVHRGHFPGIQG